MKLIPVILVLCKNKELISLRVWEWKKKELETSANVHKSTLGMPSFEENGAQIQKLYKETSAFFLSPMEVPSHSSSTIAKKTGWDVCDF